MLEVAPEDVRPTIERMIFRSKIQIANLAEDGYDLNEKDEKTQKTKWQLLADDYYPQDVAETIHEIRQTTPRKQWCKFVEDRDGTIWAHTAMGKFVYYERKMYDNPEVQEIMDWVHEKAKRKLDARPK